MTHEEMKFYEARYNNLVRALTPLPVQALIATPSRRLVYVVGSLDLDSMMKRGQEIARAVKEHLPGDYSINVVSLDEFHKLNGYMKVWFRYET